MNQALAYLMDEICAGVEIYYTGRTGGQYLKTAFILCDDYSELVSKFFLMTDDASWTDVNPGGRYKNYHAILLEVERIVSTKTPAQLSRVKELQEAMANRRERRNDFFHSTKLLDLSVQQRNCVEAFCDLLEYGEILLGNDWRDAIDANSNIATLEIMLKLERCACSDPSITPKMNKIFQAWPRNTPNNKKKGIHVTEYPEDQHLLLCVIWGGKDLRDKLKALIT
ncbi:MAG: hypothetical protein FJ023_08490 [Chloroflexi bacterium]|nr:hypothetical protein [Chloroflexota bacterium]